MAKRRTYLVTPWILGTSPGSRIAYDTPLNVVPISSASTRLRDAPAYGFRVPDAGFIVIKSTIQYPGWMIMLQVRVWCRQCRMKRSDVKGNRKTSVCCPGCLLQAYKPRPTKSGEYGLGYKMRNTRQHFLDDSASVPTAGRPRVPLMEGGSKHVLIEITMPFSHVHSLRPYSFNRTCTNRCLHRDSVDLSHASPSFGIQNHQIIVEDNWIGTRLELGNCGRSAKASCHFDKYTLKPAVRLRLTKWSKQGLILSNRSLFSTAEGPLGSTTSSYSYHLFILVVIIQGAGLRRLRITFYSYQLSILKMIRIQYIDEGFILQSPLPNTIIVRVV